MLLGLKYTFWYLVSHYHYVRMMKCLDKQIKYVMNDYVFHYFGSRFVYHTYMCDTIQVKLDALKAELTNKYPDLADQGLRPLFFFAKFTSSFMKTKYKFLYKRREKL